MFERFSEAARRSVFFARYEAAQAGWARIDSGHLLLGLLRQDKSLLNEHRHIAALQKKIEERGTSEKVSTSVDLPLADDCKKIFPRACSEADRLNSPTIEPGHLLFGILLEEDCAGAKIFREVLPDIESVHKRIEERMQRGASS